MSEGHLWKQLAVTGSLSQWRRFYGSDCPNMLSFSIHEFLATCQDYPYVMADSLLDVLTKGGHSRTLQESETVRMHPEKQGDLSLVRH